jgi:hypothetical protein
VEPILDPNARVRAKTRLVGYEWRSPQALKRRYFLGAGETGQDKRANRRSSGKTGFITHDEADKNFTLFSKEVLPRLREISRLSLIELLPLPLLARRRRCARSVEVLISWR